MGRCSRTASSHSSKVRNGHQCDPVPRFLSCRYQNVDLLTPLISQWVTQPQRVARLSRRARKLQTADARASLAAGLPTLDGIKTPNLQRKSRLVLTALALQKVCYRKTKSRGALLIHFTIYASIRKMTGEQLISEVVFSLKKKQLTFTLCYSLLCSV